MSANPTFEFTGRDSMSQGIVVIVFILGGGGLSVPMLLWEFGAVNAAAAFVIFCLLVAAGLRSSIVISDQGVVITRLWFFVPYRKYAGSRIEDVWFGGDWGLEEGATGVVVKIDGQEVHIGTHKTMHFLYDALHPLRSPGPDARAECGPERP